MPNFSGITNPYLTAPKPAILFPLGRLSAFRPANQLRHGAHGAVDAPGTGLEQNHGEKAQRGGGQHHAVKAEGELGHAGMDQGSVIRPVPRQLEGPQQCDHLAKVLDPRENQIGIPEHQEEHGEKEDQEAIPKSLAFHPVRNIPFPGQANAAAQQPEQLAPPAVAVTVPFVPADDGKQEWEDKADQANPGEQDMDKPQDEIDQGEDPEIVVPVFFHSAASRMVITVAGHSRAQMPQPTQRTGSTWAVMPFAIRIAALGQTFTQQPQATQWEASTKALREFFLT